MSYRKPTEPLSTDSPPTSARKVAAFRERTKEAGFLRKEVLVSESAAKRLAEIAQEQGTSVTTVASGLLDMGLSHYEALRGAATNTVGVTGSLASASTRNAMASAGALSSAQSGYLVAPQALLSSLRSAPAPDADALASDAFVVADPVKAFFNKRKQPK